MTAPFASLKDRLRTRSRREVPRFTRVTGGSGQLPTTTALVVGHDRQLESLAALNVAKDFANRLNATLHIVHVVDLSDFPIDPDSADWDSYERERLAAEQSMVIESMQDHPRAWSYYVGRGDPSRRLIRVAEETNALMIVVGSHGEGVRASLGRLLGPPVSHRLIQETHVPVLVVSHAREHTEYRKTLHAVRDRLTPSDRARSE